MKNDIQANSPEINEVADLLVDVAAILMTSGAHSMRINQNVSRIANQFGYQIDLSIFQLSIMMTIVANDDNNKRFTLVKKIKPLLLNFTIVSELSALSWETFDQNLSFIQVREAYEKIVNKKRASKHLVLILVSFANTAFCGLFHGDWYAMVLVFFGTMFGFLIRRVMVEKNINHLIAFTTSAFVASIVAGMGQYFNLGNTPEVAIASSVLYLIPGVPLINSILDIIQGHVLTGTARLVNALSLIVCIAIGMYGTILILGV